MIFPNYEFSAGGADDRPSGEWDCGRMESWLERIEDLLELTFEEACLARNEFPTNENRFSVMIEEVGEIGKALNEQDAEGWRYECVQAAAMCLRLAAEGDAAHKVTQGEEDSEFAENVKRMKMMQGGGNE